MMVNYSRVHQFSGITIGSGDEPPPWTFVDWHQTSNPSAKHRVQRRIGTAISVVRTLYLESNKPKTRIRGTKAIWKERMKKVIFRRNQSEGSVYVMMGQGATGFVWPNEHSKVEMGRINIRLLTSETFLMCGPLER